MLCELTGEICGQPDVVKLFTQIQNVRYFSYEARDGAIVAPSQQGFDELSKKADAYAVQAETMQLTLNSLVCSNCPLKTS